MFYKRIVTVAEAKTSVRTEEEKEIINCAKQL